MIEQFALRKHWRAEPMGLNGLDVAVIVVYLACVTLFGMRFRKQTGTLKGYFLAEKTIPWWAISLSIVAAETSTLTIISVPGMAYERDFGFLQLVIGYLVGRVIISVLLIPHYFRGELVTAYQLIERRFGQRLRALTAGLFLITRAAAEGVRVFAVAIVVGIALSSLLGGLGDFARDVAAIGIVSVLTLIYTFEGGMAAVIWTDVVQLAVYVTGTLVGFFTILHLVPGGWHTVHGVAAEAGKFRVFYFAVELLCNLHVLVGTDRRRFLDHGEPWHRPADRAAAAVVAQRAAGQDRAAGQRRDGVLPVLAVSADRRDAVCLLPAVSAGGGVYAKRTRSSRPLSSRACRTGSAGC